LRDAAEILVGAGPVKQRLCAAYLQHLRDLDVDALPDDLAASCRELAGALSSAQPTGGLGAVEVTIRKMSEADASRCATAMLDLYVNVAGRLAEPSSGLSRQLRIVGDQ
jgi:hypothetical protein